jgi:hypothetical protein
MSAEKLTVTFTPAISGRDYLAKSAKKANARGLTINVGRETLPSCGLPCDSFRSIDTTNGCRCRDNWSPE